MNIRLDVQLETTDTDLENRDASLKFIEESCLALKRQLIDELQVKVDERKQDSVRMTYFFLNGK